MNCFCCGTEVTQPQFFEGRIYGWSCIKKVNNQKRVKSKEGYVSCVVSNHESKFGIIATVGGEDFMMILPSFVIESAVVFYGIANPTNPERATKNALVNPVSGLIILEASLSSGRVLSMTAIHFLKIKSARLIPRHCWKL